MAPLSFSSLEMMNLGKLSTATAERILGDRRNSRILVLALLFLALLGLTFSKQSPVSSPTAATISTTTTTTSTSTTATTTTTTTTTTRPPHYAIAHFVEDKDQVYGIYSIHQQLKKFNMSDQVTHLVQIPRHLKGDLRRALISWLGKDNVRYVNDEIMKRIPKEKGLWTPTFNKLYNYQLTEFDKVIQMDTDVLIRTNILHWFDYGPTPCGIQAKDDVAWNSGTLVITPSMAVYRDLLDLLPHIAAWGHNKTLDQHHDPLCGQYSDQDFVAAYYTQHLNSTKHRCVMPTEAAILSSSLPGKNLQYYIRHRAHMFETVHLTVHKPWRKDTAPNHWFVCRVLHEFKASMQGMTELPPIQNDYLRNCRDYDGVSS